MSDKPEFSIKGMAKEYVYYVGTEPECMDNCFVEEPKGKKAVMVPECKYAKVYRKTMNEGTLDSWEFDDCKLRRGFGDPIDLWLWAKDACPYYKDIYASFVDDYVEWLWKEGEE